MFTIKEDLSLSDNHIGYVTSKTLIHLKVLNHAWVIVTSEDEQHGSGSSITEKFRTIEQRKDDHILQLIVKDDTTENNTLDFFNETEIPSNIPSYENDVIYVSPGALYDMAKKDTNLYKKYVSENFTVNIHILDNFLQSSKKYYAVNVDISPVSCTYGSISEEKLSKMLKEYFTEPKVLRKDELFTIRHEKKHKDNEMLWFKVNSLEQNEERCKHTETNALFVDERFSNLYLANPVNSFVPICSCSFQNNQDLIPFYRNSHYQEAFQKVTSQITDLLDIVCLKKASAKDTMVLLEGQRGVGKGLLIRSLCQSRCVHFHEVNCFDLVGESLSATEKRLENAFHLAVSTSPCVFYLKNVHILCKDREGLHEERRVLQSFLNQLMKIAVGSAILIIGSTYTSKEMSARFYSEFVYHIEIESPNEYERLCLIRAMMEGLTNQNVLPGDLARKTAGFILSDFIALFNRVQKRHLGNIDDSFETKIKDMNTVTRESIEIALEELRILKAGSSDSVKIPKVTWDDVGGLQNVKDDILDTLELPIKFPHLFSNGLQRSGLLLYGPPGCGKTLLAKAIATEFTLNFYSVKGPELINMYVGQSEENVREVFKKARSMSPCVIFFDEIDSLAPNRGRSGDSGGVMDRIVSQLLSELDGMHDNTDIFVVGATNRPDLLDPSLLRPGRFDKLIYVGIPEGQIERLKILTAVTRKLKIGDDVNIDDIVSLCPLNLTGADFYSLASGAMMNCFRRMIKSHEKDKSKLNADDAIICLDDFHSALESLVPSVSIQELERYKSIREEIIHNK